MAYVRSGGIRRGSGRSRDLAVSLVVEAGWSVAAHGEERTKGTVGWVRAVT